MSFQPGTSTEASRVVTRATSRSPATTSSISRTERSWPIASGVGPVRGRAVPGAAGQALADDGVEGAGMAAGQLDRDGRLVRLVGVKGVDVRPKATARAGEARHLPQVGEELLDLLVQLVDVSA